MRGITTIAALPSGAGRAASLPPETVAPKPMAFAPRVFPGLLDSAKLARMGYYVNAEGKVERLPKPAGGGGWAKKHFTSGISGMTVTVGKGGAGGKGGTTSFGTLVRVAGAGGGGGDIAPTNFCDECDTCGTCLKKGCMQGASAHRGEKR